MVLRGEGALAGAWPRAYVAAMKGPDLRSGSPDPWRDRRAAAELAREQEREFDAFDAPPLRKRRFRAVPVRIILPNLVTLLALCMGLTAIRFASEGQFEIAVIAVIIAAILDGLDGRIARALRGATRFGAELEFARRFRRFRRRARVDPLFLGPARDQEPRLVRRACLRDRGGAAPRALQRHGRGAGPAGVARSFLHRHAGAGGRHRRPLAALPQPVDSRGAAWSRHGLGFISPMC